MSECILEGRGLTRRYRRPDGRILTACQQIDLRLYPGETLGIVGESGCGKSTLLRMLSQLERPDEGQLLFRGEDVTGWKGENLRRHRRHIQMVFQDPAAAFSHECGMGCRDGTAAQLFLLLQRRAAGKSQAVTGNGGAPTGVSGPVSSLHERRASASGWALPGPWRWSPRCFYVMRPPLLWMSPPRISW